MDKNQVENLNESNLKNILLNFDRKFLENQKFRIKYADDPTKFVNSETELFAALDELQSVATQPELYHVLISKKTLPTLLSLLQHENTDISAKVIGMLQEFTDIDDSEEHSSTAALIKALKDENALGLVISNLSRLDESNKDEAQAINNSLAILDNLIDFDSSFATDNSKTLINWMIKLLKKNSQFNSIKLSIAELLSVLLMTNNENKLHLGDCNGIDTLLQQVAFYRRVAPVTGDEHEFLEQIINCLCIALMDCCENKEFLFKEEGVDLIELVLREKREAVKKSNIKLSTLKLLNHVLTTDKNRDELVTSCCEKFVDILGLRVLFPIFYNPKLILSEKIKKREFYQVLDEVEEHTSSIILSLLKYCQNTKSIQRILIKFAESNFEKLNKLVELHDKYFRLVSNQQNDEQESSDGDDGEKIRAKNKSESSVYYTLRTIDYIILLTCYLSNQFETYDPNSGETFTSYILNLISRRPELKHQIVFETRKHINEVSESSEEQNSLKLLVEYFEKLSKK